MLATIIHAPGDVRLEEVPDPHVLRPTDALGDAWTYRAEDDACLRHDYALASATLLPYYLPEKTFIPSHPALAAASDHRPLFLTFRIPDPATVDQRFLLDEAKAQRIEAVIADMWPERIAPGQIGDNTLTRQVIEAREALLGVLSLDELL